MNFLPISDRVIVRPDEPEDVTKGGIIIAEQAREKPQQGTVLAVGSGRRLSDGTVVSSELAVGDVVVYNKHSGTELKDKEDKSYLIMREEDILCIIR